LRGDLESVFLLYWVIRDTLCRMCADDEQKRDDKGKPSAVTLMERLRRALLKVIRLAINFCLLSFQSLYKNSCIQLLYLKFLFFRHHHQSFYTYT